MQIFMLFEDQVDKVVKWHGTDDTDIHSGRQVAAGCAHSLTVLP